MGEEIDTQQIIFKLLNGDFFPLEVSLDEEIEVIADSIKTKIGFSEEDQVRLIYKGKHLEGTKTLRDYNVQFNDVIIVIKKIPRPQAVPAPPVPEVPDVTIFPNQQSQTYPNNNNNYTNTLNSQTPLLGSDFTIGLPTLTGVLNIIIPADFQSSYHTTPNSLFNSSSRPEQARQVRSLNAEESRDYLVRLIPQIREVIDQLDPEGITNIVNSVRLVTTELGISENEIFDMLVSNPHTFVQNITRAVIALLNNGTPDYIVNLLRLISSSTDAYASAARFILNGSFDNFIQGLGPEILNTIFHIPLNDLRLFLRNFTNPDTTIDINNYIDLTNIMSGVLSTATRRQQTQPDTEHSTTSTPTPSPSQNRRTRTRTRTRQGHKQCRNNRRHRQRKSDIFNITINIGDVTINCYPTTSSR